MSLFFRKECFNHFASVEDSFKQHHSQVETVEDIPTPEDNVNDSYISSDDDESTGSSDFPSDSD